MTFVRPALLVLLGFTVSACAARSVRPPPRLEVKVGGAQAAVRDFRQGGTCDTDGERLVDELEGANRVMAVFLERTSAGPDGMWADEHLLALDEGSAQLPRVLDALEATWKALPSCRYTNASALAEATRKGKELGRQSRQRLEEAPYLKEYVTFRRELAAWQERVTTQREEAKTATCAGPRAKVAEPYFAAEDEKGAQTFEFCDGAKVQRAIGKAPEVVPPPPSPVPKKAKKPAAPPDYLSAINAFPPAEIIRAPKPPRRTGARPEAEEDDFTL